MRVNWASNPCVNGNKGSCKFTKKRKVLNDKIINLFMVGFLFCGIALQHNALFKEGDTSYLRHFNIKIKMVFTFK